MVGHADAVKALRDLKANIDYGVFKPVQEAGMVALRRDMERPDSVAPIYESRRDRFVEAMRQAGWDVDSPKATMFIWAKIPQGWTSRQISREICLNTGVVVIPGDAFGAEGEGFVRIAMVQDEEKLIEAAVRIGRFLAERR
jgi:LL-diaminopimelate aminotransferase